jgi:hypothetical protein
MTLSSLPLMLLMSFGLCEASPAGILSSDTQLSVTYTPRIRHGSHHVQQRVRWFTNALAE